MVQSQQFQNVYSKIYSNLIKLLFPNHRKSVRRLFGVFLDDFTVLIEHFWIEVLTYHTDADYAFDFAILKDGLNRSWTRVAGVITEEKPFRTDILKITEKEFFFFGFGLFGFY